MSKCNAEQHHIETASALEQVVSAGQQERHAAYVGLDVHKETIAVAVAEVGRAEPVYRGEIANKPKNVEKLVAKLSATYDGGLLQFCYEAGPCGYVLHRQILACGHDCQVVAPSKIPRTPGERIKTDRRDALKLARLLRSDDLTAVWVPDQDQEMMRDLSRARDDMKGQERKARQQLNAFVLRHGQHWPRGKSRWTQAHYNWLESLRFERPWQQVTLQEYIEAAKAASARVAQLNDHLMRALPEWSLAPVVDSLIALRGIDKLAAIVLLAELGASPAPGGHHPDGERACAAHAGRIGLELPLRGPPDDAPQAQGAERLGGGEEDRLEGPGTLVRALPHPHPGGEEHQAGVRGHRPRVGRLHLGHRAPGDGACGAAGGLRRSPTSA